MCYCIIIAYVGEWELIARPQYAREPLNRFLYTNLLMVMCVLTCRLMVV